MLVANHTYLATRHIIHVKMKITVNLALSQPKLRLTNIWKICLKKGNRRWQPIVRIYEELWQGKSQFLLLVKYASTICKFHFLLSRLSLRSKQNFRKTRISLLILRSVAKSLIILFLSLIYFQISDMAVNLRHKRKKRLATNTMLFYRRILRIPLLVLQRGSNGNGIR